MEEPTKMTLSWMEGKTLMFDAPSEGGSLLFKNDRSIVQKSPMFGDVVCDWQKITDKGHVVQVIFPLMANWTMNHYIILAYGKDDAYMTSYRSHTVYPPVWDRSFSCGPDYIDYVKTQKRALELCKEHDLGSFGLDESLEGKSVNFTTQTPEEVNKAIAENKSYSILTLKAEAAADKLKLISQSPI